MAQTESKSFPEGYGDFALLSSDGVVCYFPKGILIHTSGFFRDMFEVPSGGNYPLQGTASEPLAVTENATILELFLSHIDPAIMTPKMDPATIYDLMEAARKYSVDIILTWFRATVVVGKYHSISNTTSPSALTSWPAMVLKIAIRHDLKVVGKLAVRELFGCSRDAFYGDVDLPSKVILHIGRIRYERVKRYREYLEVFATTRRPPRLVRDETTHCGTCAVLRMRWLVSISSLVEDSPKWPTFKEAIGCETTGCSPVCSKHAEMWYSHWAPIIDRWEVETREVEAHTALKWPIL